MGHISTIGSVQRKEDILPFAEHFAAVNVDREENPSGSYHGRMTIHDVPVYDCFDDACEAIERLDDGFYDDHAVAYHPPKPERTHKKLDELEDRRKRLEEQKRKYINDHSIHNKKAIFLSCPRCSSKINKAYLVYQSANEECPVCGTDMRADYIQEKIEDYREKLKKLDQQIESERIKIERGKADRSKVYWAVKVEVHH